MNKGQTFTKEALKEIAIFLGGGEVGGNIRIKDRWVELNLWMTKKKQRGLLGRTYFVTGRKAHSDQQHIIEASQEFEEMLDLRHKIARKTAFEVSVNKMIAIL